MERGRSAAPAAGGPWVSSGHLPPDDRVRGLVAKLLSHEMGMDLFVSRPEA